MTPRKSVTKRLPARVGARVTTYDNQDCKWVEGDIVDEYTDVTYLAS